MEKEKVMPTASNPAVRRERRQLRHLLIHKPLQREFTFVTMGLLMVAMMIIAFVVHTTIRQAGYGGFQFGKISPYEILAEVRYQLLFRVTSVLLVTMTVLVVFGVFFLHRVAGPVYRFRVTFSKLNQGEIPPAVRLREGDFFVEVAEEINAHLQKLSRREEGLKQIKQKAEEIASAGSQEVILRSGRELKAILQSLS